MIQWLLRQTWLSLRGGLVSAMVASVTVAGALALVGLLAVFLFHGRQLGERWHTLSGALVYLEPGVDSDQVKELQNRLSSNSMVVSVQWISSQEALERLLRKAPRRPRWLMVYLQNSSSLIFV